MSGEVLSGAAGVVATLGAVVVAATFARRQEFRRQRGELVAAAVVDLFEALAESSLGDDKKAMALFAQTKARLLAFAPRDLIDCLVAFENAGASAGTPEGRKALVELVEAARSVAGAEGDVSEAAMRTLLLGVPAGSL